MENNFNGKVNIELVVDNYNSEEVTKAIMDKLYELDFIVSSGIEIGQN